MLRITHEHTPMNKEILKEVHPDHSFRLCDGGSINSLQGLYESLQKMDDSVFQSHVTGERNDFGNWVKDVHKDYRLANSIFGSKSKDDCIRALKDRIYEAEKILAPETKSMMIPVPQQPAMVPAPKLAPKEQPRPSTRQVLPAIDKERAAAEAKFKREELIAKAILANKSPSEVLKEASRPKPKPVPKKPEAKPKSELETASERLEKILAEAARAKIEEYSKLENAGPKIRNVVSEEAVKNSPSAEALLEEAESVSTVNEDESESYRELLELSETKSFPSQFGNEMKSVFSKSALSSFAGDMKKMFVPGRNETESAEDAVEMPVPEPAAEAPEEMDKKTMIISHLKKVYK